VVAIAFVDFGGLAWMAVAAVMGTACVIELSTMLAKWRPVTVVAVAAVAGMCVAAQFGGEHALLGAAVASVPVTFLAVLWRSDRRRPTLAIAATLLGVMWIGFAVAHAVLLRKAVHGDGIVIDVLIGTFLSDTGAYFGGRLFGRRPLAPEISPNKTVEGLVCGMITAILAVFCAGLYQTWLPHGTALALGLTIAVMAPLGDLFESLLKRDAGTKDAGRLFGAHGGALDRLDSIMFTIVACYYVWTALAH
jgi:phosphatidate cytidylyltransferase